MNKGERGLRLLRECIGSPGTSILTHLELTYMERMYVDILVGWGYVMGMRILVDCRIVLLMLWRDWGFGCLYGLMGLMCFGDACRCRR